MRYYLSILPLMASPILADSLANSLNVYTYDSFASEWGPGPTIEAGFEAQCGCDLIFTPAGDGAAMLTRLRLEGKNSNADIVLGLDQNLLDVAVKSELFAKHYMDALPIFGTNITWDHPQFTPFDWGHFAFVYRKADIANPPTSFEELADSDLRIVIESPSSSTPGLGLAVWVYNVYGDQAAEYWQRLADNIITVTPGWSEAYTLFLEGEADAVLSYSTSPAYHKIAEETDAFAAAQFAEGHALQIELAGIIKTTDQPELAAQFLTYLQSDAAQTALMKGNWMYPVKAIDIAEGFNDPSKTIALKTPTDLETINQARAAFLEGLSK